MNLKSAVKKVVGYSSHILLLICFVLILMVGYAIYTYNQAISENNRRNETFVSEYNKNIRIFNGQEDNEKVKEFYKPLVNKLISSQRRVVKQQIKPNIETINKDIFSQGNFENDVKGTWIPVPGAYDIEANYSKLDKADNEVGKIAAPVKPVTDDPDSNPPPNANANTNANANLKTKPSPAPTPKTALQSNPKSPNKDTNPIDDYVFKVLLGDLASKFSKNKSNEMNYSKYNETIWKSVFMDLQDLTNSEVFKKNYSIGKIFIASQNHIAIFPKDGSVPSSFSFSGRTWWWQNPIAKRLKDNTIIETEPENSGDTVKFREAGITIAYIDIAVDTTNVADLTRTVWFRFDYQNREYLYGVDLRFNQQNLETPVINSWFWDNITWLFIALGISLLGLLISNVYWYLKNKKGSDVFEDPTRVYKLQRIDRKNVIYDGTQNTVYKISQTVSIKNTRENKTNIKTSRILMLGSPNVKGEFGITNERIESETEEKLTNMTLAKDIDLRLDGNLKAFELWKVYHPNADNYVIGMIGVLWQNRPNDDVNDITTEYYFWDSNTSASNEDIGLALKKHLHISENSSFLFDYGASPEAEPDIVSKLKEKIPDVAEFSDKFNSFNNRRLLFDNTAKVLEELYSNDCETFATCSIEFLDNLKKQNRIKDVLTLPVRIRYIIDGENRKFRDFYKDLDEPTKDFFTNLRKLKIIEFRASQKSIYQNRDFCIVSFGKDKCVFYTDMNNAQQGWVSWREVDITYYEAIKSFIESGEVEKKDISNYLA